MSCACADAHEHSNNLQCVKVALTCVCIVWLPAIDHRKLRELLGGRWHGQHPCHVSVVTAVLTVGRVTVEGLLEFDFRFRCQSTSVSLIIDELVEQIQLEKQKVQQTTAAATSLATQPVDAEFTRGDLSTPDQISDRR